MKSSLKRVLGIMLTVSMLLSFSSCKKPEKPSAPAPKTIGENDPYYTVKETEMKLLAVPESDFSSYIVRSAQIVSDYVVASYEVSYELPELDVQYYDLLEQGKWDELADYNRQQYDTVLLIFDMNGNQVGKVPLEDDLSVNGVFSSDDGNFLAVIENTSIDSVERYKIIKFNKEGNILEASFLRSEDNPTRDCIFEMTADGNLITVNYDAIYCFNQKGEILWKTALNVDGGNGFEHRCYQDNGNWYVKGFNSSNQAYTDMLFIQGFNDKTGELNKTRIGISTALSSNIFTSGNNCYFVKDNGIYQADLINFGEKEVLDWYWADDRADNLDASSLTITPSGDMRFLSYRYVPFGISSSGQEKVIQKIRVIEYVKEEKNPYAGKTLIIMGVNEASSDALCDYVVRYNKKESSPARIQIKDYRSFTKDTLEGFKSDEVAVQLYQEMSSGTGPDILVNFSSYSQFNKEGVLLDLNAFIDGPRGMSRDDYLDNVFRAFETKGKLFQIPICVDIAGFIGNKEMIGQRTGWTFSEFEQVVGHISKDVPVIYDIEQSRLLDMLLSNSMTTFVDYDKKEVYFDSDEFKQILKLAKSYGFNQYNSPDEFSDENKAYTKLDDGKVAMVETYLYNLDTFTRGSVLCKGNAIYVGYPSPDGTGMSARPTLTLAISADSACQDPAWDFIRFLFDEAEQETLASSYMSIPMNRKVLESTMSNEIKTRNELLAKDPSLQTELSKLTEKDAEGFKSVIDNVSTISSFDMEILRVIFDEVATYFWGNDTAEDVCKRIQDRASVIIKNRK